MTSATPPRPGLRCQVVRDVDEMAALSELWHRLSRDAADPNVYYEPWMMLPALRHWYSGRDVLALFIFGENPECTTGPPILYGMVPFERRSDYRGIPARVLRLLRPPYTRLCTPLIHKQFVRETVRALLDWLALSPESGSLAEFRFIAGEGRVAQELHQQTTDRKWIVFQSESTIRALLKPRKNAELYLDDALRRRRRKEYLRLWNRLSEAGRTEFRVMRQAEDARPWVSAFLDLEAKGWKGREGTALASTEKDRHYFEEAALMAHARGQLMMLGLYHQDRPIALKMNFLSGRGSFAIKIAFDETFSRFSPGVLLEMENVRRLHARPEIDWMDSTADSEHFMINRLWIDRRTMETFLVSPERFWGNLVATAYPALRGIKFMLQRRPASVAPLPPPAIGAHHDPSHPR